MTDSALVIRLLEAGDVAEMHAMALRVVTLSGRDGAPIYNPFDDAEPWTLERVGTRREEGWKIPAGDCGWVRTFGIVTPSGAVHGELTLEHCPVLVASLHRCLLTMELDLGLRGQGWGTRLLKHAVAWAEAQAHLRWIDLGVFAGNDAAARLYRSAGFTEVGRREDYFRVHGQQITDIQMSLDLRESSRSEA